LNLYDIAALAHFELFKSLPQGSQGAQDLLNNRKKLLEAALVQSQRDPFHYALMYDSGEDLAPLAFGVYIEASLYNELSKSQSVRNFLKWKFLIFTSI
jgi:hypothetical protein